MKLSFSAVLLSVYVCAHGIEKRTDNTPKCPGMMGGKCPNYGYPGPESTQAAETQVPTAETEAPTTATTGGAPPPQETEAAGGEGYEGPPPDNVTMGDIVYGGSGCPQGTASQALAADKKSFTLIFDKFIAKSGPGSSITDRRKNCQINIPIKYPQGYSYSVATFDFRGYAKIPKGVVGVQKANYYYAGSVASYTGKTVLPGKFEGDYVLRDVIPMEKVTWSPCGQVVNGNVNAQIKLMGKQDKEAMITTDSVDGKIKIICGIKWKKC
jgi:hypothetical protein